MSPAPRSRERVGARVRKARVRQSVRSLATALTVALALAACGGDKVGVFPITTVDKVTVEPVESVVASAKTVTLTARAFNSSGTALTGAGMAWSTSDAAVATVTQSGVVTTIASGVARITASANGRSGSSLVSVSTSTQQSVPAGGGTVTTPGGEVKVTLPNGALPAGGSVTIEPVTTGTAPGATVPGTVYKIGLFGISTGPRPTITVHYSVTGLPAGFDETKLKLSRKVGIFWIPLPSTVNTTEKTITAILPAAAMVTSATEFGATTVLADEEATVGGTLFAFAADVTSLELTVGDRRKVTGRVIALATNAATPLSGASASSSANGVASASGAATVPGTEMSADIVANAPGTALITLSAAISSGGSTETFAGVISVSVAAAASLNVNVGGLPAGVNGDVTVTGPGNFSRKLTTSQNLGAVTPGSYTITAGSVSSDGQTYNANPPSQTTTVNAGQAQTATVSYAPTLGTLSLTINGLPAGTNAAVTVTGPGGFSRAVTASSTLSGLAPGSYTVAASNVTAGSQLYAPAPATQSAAVVPGQSATATVAYAVGVGALNVDISGLPVGVDAAVTITGPNAFSRLVTATTTLTGLAPGTYNVGVGGVDTPLQLYAPTTTVPSVSVVAGQTATLSVGYVATLGQFTVTISGCGSPDVSVTGPNGYLKQGLTNGQSVSRLAPGTYTITAAATSVGPAGNALLCKPVVPVQQVAVTAGGAGAVTVSYAQGYVVTIIKVSGSPTDVVSISAPGCTPATLCGVQGFYPVGTAINISVTANPLSRVASVAGPGTCTFAPPPTDASGSFNCTFTVTATSSVTVTFQVLAAATMVKASADSTTTKASQALQLCCSAVLVSNARGTPMGGVSVSWLAAGNPNPFVNATGADGIAGASLVFPSTPGVGTYTVTATITLGTCETRSITFTYFVVAGSVVAASETESSVVGASRPAPASRSGATGGLGSSVGSATCSAGRTQAAAPVSR